jgi:hypothetical protein
MFITDKIKRIVIYVAIGLILALGTTCIIQYNVNQSLKEEHAIATANVKALLEDRNVKDNEIIELQLSMDVLRNTSDSIIQNLLEQKEKLNIKNRELQTMISMASQFHVHDTIPIPIHDTIFCEPDFAFDTCVSDEWRTTCVEMRYPNEVCVDATMRSQKEVFVTAKRETIEPPSKCFFIRWFQKKHTVTRITINEENPYIEDQENVYIRVID